jgi:quinol-cytochrome oxidoreductase complex cytochrome b subunit/coenzyme F420-reducing hydrogenase delta subunit
MSRLRLALRALFERAENGVERIFGPLWNPMRQLGALGWLLFWVITVSGVYLYIFFDTGIDQAYESVQSLTHEQWWAGGIMRSLHRYASDALVIVALVHMVREFAFDRLHGPRWFAWFTGLLVLGFIYVCGVTGYWMVWDQLAQYVAITTSEWLDQLPLFAKPIARNFLADEYLSGRFFTLMAYVHIAAPLLMLLLMWIHIARYAESRVTAARGLAWSVVGALLIVSLLRPALSQPPADLDRIPADIGLDWFYLALYPLLDRWGGAAVWILVLGGGVVLALLPWIRRPKPAPVAVVHLDNCNGCGRCVTDCPFSAIALMPRTDGAPFAQQAEVNASRCVSCGICVGACPTATPFRQASALVPGIELPDELLVKLREDVVARTAKLRGRQRLLALVCRHGAAVADSDSVCAISIPCVGMLPPPFIDFVLARRLADGVMLAGCRERECYHRLGDRWTEARIDGTRDPRLRERVDRGRVAVSWASSSQPVARHTDVDSFRAALGAASPKVRGRLSAWHRLPERLAFPWRMLGQVALYAIVGVSLAYCAVAPRHQSLGRDEAVISLSFSHAGRPKQPCKSLSAEELARLSPNMRRPRNCPRERWPMDVELIVNEARLYAGTHRPAGLWDDGPSTVYERFRVPAGEKVVTVRLRDSGRQSGYDYERTAEVELRPGENLVIDFSTDSGEFSIR